MAKATKVSLVDFARIRAYHTKDGEPRAKFAPAKGSTPDKNGLRYEVSGKTVDVFVTVYVDGHESDAVSLPIGEPVLKASAGKAGGDDETAAIARFIAAGLTPEQAVAAARASA